MIRIEYIERQKQWVERSSAIEKIALLVAILLIAHFAVSLGLWSLMIGVEVSRMIRVPPRMGIWNELLAWSPWFARSAKALLPFALACVSLWTLKRSAKTAVCWLAAAVGVSVLLFGYDAMTSNSDYTTYTRRYPVQDETCHYATWWWYSHPLVR